MLCQSHLAPCLYFWCRPLYHPVSCSALQDTNLLMPAPITKVFGVQTWHESHTQPHHVKAPQTSGREAWVPGDATPGSIPKVFHLGGRASETPPYITQLHKTQQAGTVASRGPPQEMTTHKVSAMNSQGVGRMVPKHGETGGYRGWHFCTQLKLLGPWGQSPGLNSHIQPGVLMSQAL